MTLLFADGFDQYTVSADMTTRWTRGGFDSLETGTGRFGGNHLRIANFASRRNRAPITATDVSVATGTALHMAFWWKTTSLPTTVRYPIHGHSNSGESQQTYHCGTAAAGSVLSGRQGGGNNWYFQSVDRKLIRINTWHHIQTRFQSDNTNGISQIWVDGYLAQDITTEDTYQGGGLTADMIDMWGGWSTGNDFDDVIVWDELGSDFNYSGAIKEHRIETLLPDGNASVSWGTTDSSMNNYTMVDESGFHDDDTSWVQGISIGDIDRYTFADQVTQPSQTLAIGVHNVVRKTDAGAITIRNVIEHNSIVSEGADKNLADTFAHYDEYYEVNPDTGVAWGATDINSVSAGIKFQG